MQIKEKMLNRIVSLLMCILLLSNFGLSITLAVEGNVAKFSFANATKGEISTKNYETKSAPFERYGSNFKKFGK